jgi:hypothetical protein
MQHDSTVVSLIQMACRYIRCWKETKVQRGRRTFILSDTKKQLNAK